MRRYVRALRVITGDRISRFTFAGATALFFVLSLLLLVVTIPGNSLGFQLSILTPREFVLLAVLAATFGLSAAVQVYLWKTKRAARSVRRGIVQGAVPAASGFFAAAVGTAACSMCLATLFGLVGLGTGSVLFVLEHRAVFLLAAITLMFGSLLFAVRKVDVTCGACEPQTTSHAG